MNNQRDGLRRMCLHTLQKMCANDKGKFGNLTAVVDNVKLTELDREIKKSCKISKRSKKVEKLTDRENMKHTLKLIVSCEKHKGWMNGIMLRELPSCLRNKFLDKFEGEMT
ncbi:CLUMA_CG007598, isoform A [Clunio marinus]|uniref:CLUMA_CG007598, isoform A n=1 Tax=Clunio marinus TaxID=568069 RepID=A0A1J1I1J0_9DIPT|nr:CLUMA_CG007598, isoform A [Clunio marinus]